MEQWIEELKGRAELAQRNLEALTVNPIGVLELIAKVEELTEQVEKMPKWISVKDELPEKSPDVFVMAKFTEQFLATPGMYNRRPCEVVSGNYVHLNTRIYTHWMAITSPPAEAQP